MCYSAMIQADYDKFCRHHGAIMSLEDFAMNVWSAPDRKKKRDGRRRMPKAVEDWFLRPQRDGLGQDIGQAIREARAQEQAELASDLAAQLERKAINEAKLATKPTKTAANEVRIATDKIAMFERRIADAESDVQGLVLAIESLSLRAIAASQMLFNYVQMTHRLYGAPLPGQPGDPRIAQLPASQAPHKKPAKKQRATKANRAK